MRLALMQSRIETIRHAYLREPAGILFHASLNGHITVKLLLLPQENRPVADVGIMFAEREVYLLSSELMRSSFDLSTKEKVTWLVKRRNTDE